MLDAVLLRELVFEKGPDDGHRETCVPGGGPPYAKEFAALPVPTTFPMSNKTLEFGKKGHKRHIRRRKLRILPCVDPATSNTRLRSERIPMCIPTRKMKTKRERINKNNDELKKFQIPNCTYSNERERNEDRESKLGPLRLVLLLSRLGRGSAGA
ncbi:hypothetical protein WA026_020585 [Henosepilachna vigintioctopunctata]|uniref:Uncharacterized protein n=1 Tax=Henosepilachna vigintioctopunctata TaxID=420089 RepID=A0AAW1UWB9_9CUCU